MTTAMTVVGCSICRGERGPVVNTFLASGQSATFIEREMKRLGTPTKAETVLRHLRVCLNGKRPPMAASPKGVSNADFAAAVRDEAKRMLDAGVLKVRTTDGLQAQALLDKREEKKADRDLLINLARLMTGSPPPAEIIVGEYEVLE